MGTFPHRVNNLVNIDGYYSRPWLMELIGAYDCIDISTEQDSFYCYPKQENVVTKLAFATEEIYRRNLHAITSKAV